MNPQIEIRSAFFGLALSFLTATNSAIATPDFHMDIAPLLREYCAGCHNDSDREGDLTVETYAGLMRGGESGASIVPGKAAESYLIHTVTGQDKPKMPPKKEPQLSDEKIALLKAWVDAGAKGPSPAQDLSILSSLVVPIVVANEKLDLPISALTHSPNGLRMALARYDTVEILDATSRKSLMTLGGHPGKVNSVHYSADGKTLVTASGIEGLKGVAILWDAETGTKMAEFGNGSRDTFYDAELSPNGEVLAAAGYDRLVRMWDIKTGKLMHELDVHNGAIFDLAFSVDGRILASASGDQTIKLWRVADGERMDTLNQPEGDQHSVVFTPDGRHILAAGADKRIRMWRLVSVDKPRLNPLVHARFAHEDDIVRMAISADGKTLVSSSADRSLKVWNLPKLEIMTVFDQQPDLAGAISIHKDGQEVTVGRLDGSLGHFKWKGKAPANPKAQITASDLGQETQHPEDEKLQELTEVQPNDKPDQATPIPLPSRISGVIYPTGDSDWYQFRALAGEEWVFEVKAAQMKSPLDSRLEVTHLDGSPVEQVRLQAVRDSWLTFRGKDSSTSDDFRLHNWMEMDLDDYLYVNGEVVRLWRYPRGVDSGFRVYPGTGARHGFFNTSPISHPLGAPAYIVKPLPPGGDPTPNGLPVFRLYFENDDDPQRRLGKDSHLVFAAPQDGEFLVRIHDVRGHGGPDFKYELSARRRAEGFKVEVVEKSFTVSPGAAKEFNFKIERLDRFEGSIRIDVTGALPGFQITTPIMVQEGQFEASGVIFADPNAVAPSAEVAEKIRLTATAIIRGKSVTQDLGPLGEIKLDDPPPFLMEIVADGESGQPRIGESGHLELTLHPGETISAVVKLDRSEGFDAEVRFGNDESGRNLPFGVFVDNIGLSGLLVLKGENERQFFITAGPEWLPESTQFFHLRTTDDRKQACRPVILHVRKKPSVAAR